MIITSCMPQQKPQWMHVVEVNFFGVKVWIHYGPQNLLQHDWTELQINALLCLFKLEPAPCCSNVFLNNDIMHTVKKCSFKMCKNLFFTTWSNHPFTADFKIIMFQEPFRSDMRCYAHNPVNVSAWPWYKLKGIVPIMVLRYYGWPQSRLSELWIQKCPSAHNCCTELSPTWCFLLFHRSLRV